MRNRHVRLLIVAAFLALLVTPAAMQAPGPFTIEQIMNAPFPAGLVAAPTGGKVAWVFNAQGVRNIWVADAPDYKGRPFTAYTEDDGQEITNLTWMPDARAIVFVRGGGANRQGEYPNPLSDPDGVEQAIWLISLAGGAPRRLAEGSAPAVSPKGDRVAYVSRGQAWWAPLDGSEKPSQAIKARGQAGSLVWSPDGSKLAFVSSRGDHSFIGVLDVTAGTMGFLDPSVDRDGNPVWSPDGTRIAFARIPASRRPFTFGPHREDEPWSIRVADVATGAGREVWRAERGPGSVFQTVAADSQILWGAGERLVFPWERTGWLSLYAVPARGGKAELLTPGEFEVEHVALGPDRASVVYSSNQDDIDRRHIWRVAVAGGRPTRLTSGSGIEWAPVVTADGQALAFLRSDAWKPARPAIQVGSQAARDLAPDAIPPDFPSAALVEPRAVTFAAADGMRIPGQLFLPKEEAHLSNARGAPPPLAGAPPLADSRVAPAAGAAPGDRRPAVVFFHGGSRRQMLLGWHYLAYYHNTYALNQYLASRGFIVLSVNYRSGTGYGLEFREALNYGAHGASEFNDVLGAGLYLRSRSDVDPARIGLWGGSYGGYLTAMGLSRASDLFAAGVDIHGVHDWNVVIRNFSPSYDPVARQEAARRAFESSPMAWIRSWRSPVLLIHGDDDRNVPFSETVDLVEELRRQGVEFEQLVFPDEVHSFLTQARWVQAFHAAARFFERRLGMGGQRPSQGKDQD